MASRATDRSSREEGRLLNLLPVGGTGLRAADPKCVNFHAEWKGPIWPFPPLVAAASHGNAAVSFRATWVELVIRPGER